MRKLTLLLSIFIGITAFGQEFLGIRQSNYAGVQSISMNPANVVDGRYKLDVNLLSGNISAYNNYISLDASVLNKQDMTDTVNGAWHDSLFQDKYLNERMNDDFKQVFLNAEIQLPSFTIQISDYDAIGFDWKIRNYLNVDGISPELAKLMYEDVDWMAYWNNYNNERVSVQFMQWAEYGLVYGRVLKDDEHTFLKVGGKVKILQGMASAYTYIENLDYEFSNDSILTINNTSASYGHSTGFEFDENLLPWNNYKLNSKLGLGLDIGVVYEYRPSHAEHVYDMDGEEGLWRDDRNKYKWRLGFSIIDIGHLKFEKDPASFNLVVDTAAWDFREEDISSVSDYDSLLNVMFNKEQDVGYFKMNLPTAIILNADYHIQNDFYANAMVYFALQYKKNEDKVHGFTNVSLTPRYDHSWFGAAIPISYSSTAGFRVGMGLRLGPVWIGSSDLKGLFRIGEIYGADLYVGTKVPIHHRHPKDSDEDKVSDKMDECPDVPGVWEFLGCPDTDMDGIQDINDDCPIEPGPAEYNGCPDTDKDGILDKNDDCIQEPGLVEFNGCPDTDSDGIMDKEDDCPTVAGLPEFNGCPDTDGDGLMDKQDECPTEPGPLENHGCPEETRLHLVDTYGDIVETAVQDEDGSFVFTNLPIDQNYLFLLDGDDPNIGDMIHVILRNSDGDHPIQALLNSVGYYEYIYLPTDIAELDTMDAQDVEIVLLPEEEEILNTAFSNLEFETAKAIIRSESYESLDELAILLAKKPEWKLLLAGHTDSEGSASTNLTLSKKRAEAVKYYLIERGIDPERIQTVYFGESQPIADNDTPEGRQQNRRVEMTVLQFNGN